MRISDGSSDVCSSELFAPLRFTVAPETMALMRQMSASGELDALVPERVWQALSMALAAKQPSAFIRPLPDCGALAAVLPEVDALYGVRSDARRVGTECVSTFSTRWSPYPYKKK